MRKLWVALALVVAFPLLTAGTCNKQVVRDKAVYEAELNFWEQTSVQTADALTEFVKMHCTCDAGKFATETCEKAAKKALVVKTRVPYHHQMALYNAGLLKDRPPQEPPEVPATSTLCP